MFSSASQQWLEHKLKIFIDRGWWWFGNHWIKLFKTGLFGGISSFVYYEICLVQEIQVNKEITPKCCWQFVYW